MLVIITLSMVGVFIFSYIKVIFGKIKEYFRVNKILFVAWSVMFVGIAVFSQQVGQVTNVAAIDSSSRNQLLAMFLAGVLSILLCNKYYAYNKAFSLPLILLFLYGLSGILTSIFSPTPMLSAYKATLVIVDVLLAASAIKILDGKADMRLYLANIVYGILAVFLIGSLIGIFIRPHDALLPSGGAIGVILFGTFPVLNANELGFLAAVLAIVSFTRSLKFKGRVKNRPLWLAIMTLALVVVFLAQSRTAIVSFVFAAGFILWFAPGYRKYTVIPIVLLFFSIIFVASVGDVTELSVVSSGAEYLQRGQEESGLRSIKGRANAWTGIGLEMFFDNPLIGHGFDAGVRYGGAEYGIKTHMHNSYFQVLANSGLLGFIPWFIFIIMVSVYITKNFRRNLKNSVDIASNAHIEVMAVLLVILLRSITGSVMVNHSWAGMLLLALFVYCVLNKNPIPAFNQNQPDNLKKKNIKQEQGVTVTLR